jgi:GTP-binding protein LepA
VLNKIDLPAAEPEQVRAQIEDVIGIDASGAISVSAKTGVGIEELMESLVKVLPPPEGNAEAPLKALLVDSWYDTYLGVMVLVRIIDGTLKKGMRVKMMQAETDHLVDRVGVLSLQTLWLMNSARVKLVFLPLPLKKFHKPMSVIQLQNLKMKHLKHYQALSPYKA